MPIYEVAVTEIVKYVVPVEFDGDWDEEAINEAAVELVVNTIDRDQWCTAVTEREAQYIGVA